MLNLSRRQILCALGTAPLISTVPSAFAGQGWQANGFQRLGNLAADRVDEGQAVGLVVGLSARGLRKMAFYGLESLSTRKAVSEETSFRIASVTKPFTAACILSLCENGDLSLDATIDQFFPDFPQANKVTIYHLLTHTAGLANWWGQLPDDVLDTFMDRPTPHTALARMRGLYLFEPGTMRSYSNSGYVLLGEIIEQVRGQPFEDVLHQSLLSRCGAFGVNLERTGSTSDNWATGYAYDGVRYASAQDTPMPFAAGGLRSNLHDLLAFSDALFHGMLLKEDSLERMTQHARVADGRLVEDALYSAAGTDPDPWPQNTTEFGYGLGINTWIQSGERFYSHAGLIDGFSSYLVYAPRTQTTIALLSNTQTGTGPLHQVARDILIAA